MTENVTDEQAAVLDGISERVGSESMDEMAKEFETEETEDATGEEDDEGGNTPYVSFASKQAFQDAIDARLKERMERLERKQAEEKQKAEAEARQKALEENEEFKELAEERAKRIAELEKSLEELNPYKESSERYKEVVTSQLEAQKKDLPEYLKPLLEDKDPVDQLAWLSENRASLGVDEQPVGSRPSSRAATGPTNQQIDKEAQQAERQRLTSAL